MANSDTLQDLNKGFLFARLSAQQLELVANHSRRMKFTEGQALFEQGDPVENFFLVIRGKVKLYRLSPDGQEKVIEIVQSGQTFAEALMFLEHPHFPVGATALSEVELIAIDTREFLRMLRGSVDTCFLLLGELSQRLRGLIREIDTLSLHTGTCRVAHYLLDKAPLDRDTYRLDLPKGVIASRLSVKPETFSRILKSLNSQGIVSVQGSQVTIHDRGKLSAQADMEAIKVV